MLPPMLHTRVVNGADGHGEHTPFRTPKLPPSIGAAKSPGSQYYAAYGVGFVEDVIRHLALPPESVVIDPWNGSGTTTQVAADHGLTVVGIDINPALVLVGKSKLVGADVVESLHALTSEVLVRARRNYVTAEPTEPLTQWFTPGTAGYLRSIERAIQHLLVEPNGDMKMTTSGALDQVSGLAASFYVVLFETVRSFLGAYTTTNPTWIKVHPDTRDVTASKDRIDSRFRAVEQRQHQHLLALTAPPGGRDSNARVMLGSSSAIPLEDSAAGACITSPPYCTRIDYVVLTRPELAVLGMGDDDDLRRLRDTSIGTPTIIGDTVAATDGWGDYVSTLVGMIEKHPSKASATYYRKFFVQYFDSMYRSLAELRRVLSDGAPCAMVVQDSYYKDIHIDLARALTEMAKGQGWTVDDRIDFAVPQVRAKMHPGSRRYRTTFTATESLVLLTA